LRIWLVLLLYVLVALLLTYPLAFDPHQVPNHSRDVWIGLWNDWWFRQALSTGENLFHTPMLFHPQGLSLATHSNSPLFSAVSALWFPLVGRVGSFNFSILTTLVLGAWGAYLLVYDLTEHSFAAFAAGLVYAFAPYHVSQALAHPNLASVQWIPFTALFLRRTLREARLRDALASGLFFALTVWSGLHLGLLAGLWAGVFVAWMVAVEGQARSRATWIALGAAALVALLLSAPALVPTFRAWRSGSIGETVLLNEIEEGQTDVLSYILPPRYHPVFGDRILSVYNQLDYGKNFYWMAYMGFVPLALAILAVRKQWRAARFWSITGLLWILLALGAFLRVGGEVYSSIRLPYALFGQRFPFNTLRSSDRFNILVPLSLAALVGIALRHLRRRWVAALFAGAVALEYLFVPVPMQAPPQLSPFIQKMAQDPGEYAILDLPMGRGASKLWMYLQTIHEQPLVEGMAARTPPRAYDFIEETPLLQTFRHGGTVAPDVAAAGLDRLSQNGVRYVLIHRDLASAEAISRWSSMLPHPPVFRDDTLEVYATDDAQFCRDAASPAGTAGVPLDFRLGEGLRLVAWEPTWDGPVQPGGLLHFNLCWASEVTPHRSLQVFAHFLGQGLEPLAQADGPPQQGVHPTSEWHAGELVLDWRTMTLPEDLPPGRYRLLVGLYRLEQGERLSVLDAQGHSTPADAIPLGTVEVTVR
jgi:hypothetical protein